jgi:diguanylate cyclase (GGDEF)-like protein
MNFTKVIQTCLLITIAALVVAGIYTSGVIRQRQQALDKILRYNVAYDSSQAAIEFARLQMSLMQFDRAPTQANLDDAKLRFEILVNRFEVFRNGQFLRFIDMDPEHRRIFNLFKAVIAAVDPIMASADVELDADKPLALLQPLEKELIGFASQANRFVAALAAGDHAQLVRLHWQFSSLTFGLMICGLCLGLVMMWHNRLLMRAHDRLSATTGDLKRAAADLAAANVTIETANDGLRRQNSLLVQKENALQEQNMLFDAALNNMSQGLCMFDAALRPIVFNRQFEHLFHVRDLPRPDTFPGIESDRSLREMTPELAARLSENIGGARAAAFETEFSDGRVIAVSQRPMPDGDWVATFEDVTEQRRAQARIIHMARHDGLTNLPNRYAFRERLQDAIEESAASSSMLAVMCVDLDNFKEVNDTLGHPVGDALLCAAAERLTACIRETDMVARFGGDEFAILQPSIGRAEEAEGLAERLVEAMRKPFQLNGELVYVTGSLGVALSPTHGDDPDVLLKNADLALYAAKAEGRRTFRFFEPEMEERLSSRHAMERDLRQALEAGQFDLHYQPVVHLRTMKVTGFEALLRWKHPVRGSVPPSIFIPIAEDAGLIAEIGRWVLRQACADAVRWPPHLKVSVNLSAAQFAHGDITADITDALRSASLRPERLIVEITESLLLIDNKGTLDTLKRLKALGIEIAMDDFGTGYSSLSYLRNYPFDRIKIDRAFVSTASQGEQAGAIIQTIVHLGRSLGMTTVAEGVETEKDLNMVLAAGCSEGQGYLFSPAVPRDQVFALLASLEQKVGKVA